MHRLGFDLDTALLQTFVAVAESGSFTHTAALVGRTQSAVSLQIKRLEDITGQTLLERSNKKVVLTPAGTTVLTYARRLLLLNQEMKSQLQEPEVEGLVRLGTPEDFATFYLPRALARFAHTHPRTQLSVACDLTLNLQAAYNKKQFDVVLLKREPATREPGMRVWREPLVWVAGPLVGEKQTTLPLVLSPEPCVYRQRAISSLDKVHKKWRMTYTSPSLAGVIAAVKAGLGVTVLPKAMVPEDLRVLSGRTLPRLPDTEIALLVRPGATKAAHKLAEHLVSSLEHASDKPD